MNNKKFYFFALCLLLIGSVFLSSGVLGAGEVCTGPGCCPGSGGSCDVTPKGLGFLNPLKNIRSIGNTGIGSAVDSTQGKAQGVGSGNPDLLPTDSSAPKGSSTSTDDSTKSASNSGTTDDSTKAPSDTTSTTDKPSVPTDTSTATTDTADPNAPKGEDCNTGDAKGNDFNINDMLDGLGAKGDDGTNKPDEKSSASGDGPNNGVNGSKYKSDSNGKFTGGVKDAKSIDSKKFNEAMKKFSKMSEADKKKAWDKIKDNKELMNNFKTALESKLAGKDGNKIDLGGLFDSGKAGKLEWRDNGVIKAGNGYVDLCQIEKLNNGGAKPSTFNAWNSDGSKKEFTRDAKSMIPSKISMTDKGLSYEFGKTGVLNLNGAAGSYSYNALTGGINVGSSKDSIATWVNTGNGNLDISTSDGKNYDIKTNVVMGDKPGVGYFPYVQTSDGLHSLSAQSKGITNANDPLIKQTQASQGFYSINGKNYYRYADSVNEIYSDSTITVDSSGKVVNSVHSFYDPNGNKKENSLGYVFFGDKGSYSNTALFDKTNANFNGNVIYDQKGNMGNLDFSKEGKQTYVNGARILEKDNNGEFKERVVSGINSQKSYDSKIKVGGSDYGSFSGGQLKDAKGNVVTQQQPQGVKPGTIPVDPTNPGEIPVKPGDGEIKIEDDNGKGSGGLGDYKSVGQSLYGRTVNSFLSGAEQNIKTGYGGEYQKALADGKPFNIVLSGESCGPCKTYKATNGLSNGWNAEKRVLVLTGSGYGNWGVGVPYIMSSK